MASPEADSCLNQVLILALEKIIKNASWRKHSKLATECKSVIEHLTTPNPNPSSSPPPPPTQSDPHSSPSHPGILLYFSLFDSGLILSPFINSISSNHNKDVEPELDAVQKLIAHGYLHGEADPGGGTDAQLLSKVIESVCKCHDLGVGECGVVGDQDAFGFDR
ncbi:Brefeldin A-inhibited guanine nucleotide-exchange protein 2 [Abeliophyllum distichum]|uniref:Brefeldin A-inhibited guanine nucleotide-exchange protein 2 n=1 Tax=Abeliophyllum distichum TaxID=126358 RepID=A0ABD1TFD4_9LAMI